jgi:hypothetical protein
MIRDVPMYDDLEELLAHRRSVTDQMEKKRLRIIPGAFHPMVSRSGTFGPLG